MNFYTTNSQPFRYLNKTLRQFRYQTVWYSKQPYGYLYIVLCHKYGYSLGHVGTIRYQSIGVSMGLYRKIKPLTHYLGSIRYEALGYPAALLSVHLLLVFVVQSCLLVLLCSSSSTRRLTAARLTATASRGLTARLAPAASHASFIRSPARWPHSLSQSDRPRASQTALKLETSLYQASHGARVKEDLYNGNHTLAYSVELYPLLVMAAIPAVVIAIASQRPARNLLNDRRIYDELAPVTAPTQLAPAHTVAPTTQLPTCAPHPVATTVRTAATALSSVASVCVVHRLLCIALAVIQVALCSDWKCRTQDGQVVALPAQSLGSSTIASKYDTATATKGTPVRVVVVAMLGTPSMHSLGTPVVTCNVNHFILLLLRVYRHLAQKNSFTNRISNLINNSITWLVGPAELALEARYVS